MKIFSSNFWLPKAGNTEKEYEDAFAPSESGEQEADILRFAVADGSSEGMFCGEWAKIATEAFTGFKEYQTDIEIILSEAYQTWEEWMKYYLDHRKKSKPIQWYEEIGFQRGAFTTLLGLTLLDCDQKWEAFALGDSCMFQVRDEKLITNIPISDSSEFNNNPFLIPSNYSEKITERVKMYEGNFQSGDIFYLMTDAIAWWFLKEHEEGDYPWVAIQCAYGEYDQKGFKKWIKDLRKTRFRNDDVTLIQIKVL